MNVTNASSVQVSYGRGSALGFAETANGGTSWTTTTLDVPASTVQNTSIDASGTKIFITYSIGIGQRRLARYIQGATFPVSEDTPTTISKAALTRLRMEVSNEGGTATSTSAFLLEYATSSGASVWTPIGTTPASVAHWVMKESVNLTDGASTTNVSDGLTDSPGHSFLAGQAKDTGNQTAGILLADTDFTELEYSITATTTAIGGQTYYFRVSNAGADLNTYAIYASATVAGVTAPSVFGVTLNGDNPIILLPNTTTTITVVASTTDGGVPLSYATSSIFRSGVGAGCTPSNLNCYQLASSSCTFADATSSIVCSADIWFFADATDSSSSYNGQTWEAMITVHDSSGQTGSDSTTPGVILSTLLAFNVTPATTTYGTVSPGTNTSSTNQVSTVKNAGNSSSTLSLSGTALVFDINIIATSSQHYATSTFTFGGAEQALTDIITAVSGFLLTAPTSTSAVSSPTYWGIEILGGNPPGTYGGTNIFTAAFSP